MKRREQTRTQEAPFFTVDDHLRVQHQIEVRAYELWCAGRCREESALSDWIRAEREVLEQFVLAYNAPHLESGRQADDRLPESNRRYRTRRTQGNARTMNPRNPYEQP